MSNLFLIFCVVIFFLDVRPRLWQSLMNETKKHCLCVSKNVQSQVMHRVIRLYFCVFYKPPLAATVEENGEVEEDVR